MPGAVPRPPPWLSRRLSRLAAVPGQDPPARRPEAGGGKGSEDGRPPRLFRPGEVPPHPEAGLLFAFAVTSARDSLRQRRGLGGGGCPPWRSPGRGGGLAAAAAWPGRRHHVSHSQPRGPRWATPSDCSPDPSPGPEERWGGRPSGARRGQLFSHPPWPPPVRREKPSAGQTWQTSPPAFPQLGGRVTVAKRSCRECPSSSLRPESPVQPAGRRGALGAAAAGYPGLPSHTHTARAAAKPGGETGRALPAPWTDGDASRGGANRRDANGLRRGCGRAEGLSVSPALAVRGETPGARDRSDHARGVVLEGMGMGRASPFAFGYSGTAERG